MEQKDALSMNRMLDRYNLWGISGECCLGNAIISESPNQLCIPFY